MRKTRLSSPLTLLVLLLLTIILAPAARMMDEEEERETPQCNDTVVRLAGLPYLNGLPVIQEDLEIVGASVMVSVQIPDCDVVTLQSLKFSWKMNGPSGPVTLTAANTLRPHFRPTVPGDYEAVLTYCPETCRNVKVESLTMDILPQVARRNFSVVSELPLPPDTEPELNALALTATTNSVDANHVGRRRKCGNPGIDMEVFTPQLVPVLPWLNQNSYRLLEGKVIGSNIAGTDNELNHTSHDAHINVLPDPRSANLKVPTEQGVEKEVMGVEWESDSFPGPMRPLPGDRISAYGFHTYDCHHNDDRFGILSEIHPAVLTAVHRRRPIRLTDRWEGLGTNIYIPGIITDVWANKRAGEMSSNCSSTGLHQEARIDSNFNPQRIIFGACIRSPHPLDRKFTFNIYLPPNPQRRLAAAGVSAPPAQLYLNVERASDSAERTTVQIVAAGGVTSLLVTVDLTGYSGEEYSARIVAGWVQPSPDNWGLERYKVGITAIDIHDDHDSIPTDDGDWIFWAGINNRDKEWTRLLNGGDVTGFHTFGGRPFETDEAGSLQADRSLGPHLLLFHPHPVDFTGHSLQDLNRSFLMHTSGYDAELLDDPTGMINLLHLAPFNAPIGSRPRIIGFSDKADYRLHYFIERLGPVPPNLSDAGKALALVYTVRPRQARCTRVSNRACVLFPEGSVATAWHPLQAELRPGGPDLRWRDFPSFEPQELEEWGFTGISPSELGKSLARMRNADPQRVEQSFVEMREEFDRVRGTKMEGEFAKSLPVLKASVPADLWQRHFGNIAPPHPGRPRRGWLWVAISAIVALIAVATFWFFRRPRARIA